MKRIAIVLFALFLLSACSTHTDTLSTRSLTENKVKEWKDAGDAYAFDSITNSAVWSTLQTLEEMQAACQLPRDVLNSMSTEGLIQTCMNYPLYAISGAYNNQLDGIRVILEGFNGFEELQTRTDAAESLIAYYASMDIGRIAKDALNQVSDGKWNISHVGYIELIMTAQWILTLYKEPYVSQLESVAYDQYEAKLKQLDVSSWINYSLLLCAQIQLCTHSDLTAEEQSVLETFLASGGIGNASAVSEILFARK
jgi:hypothetical protein